MNVVAMETRLKGKHILIILLGFFGVVAAVNIAFIYLALSTGPGEERGASYEAGLRYNSTLAEERSQGALKWRHQALVTEGSRLRLAITNADGAPVAGLAVSGMVGRPASNNADASLVFKEADAGVYEADIASLGAGSWVLAFTAEKVRPGGEPAVYRVKERLWLSPAH
jgi:nitrogen fixation protein FixH